MRKLIAFTLLAAATALAADSDFNGRWDISANTKPRPRAWWVELNRVGTLQASGKFVSAYSGDMNVIDTIAVENGELRFTIKPPKGNTKAGGPSVYRARMKGAKMEGSFAVEGSSAPPIEWTAVRAPAIKDRDDGTWQEGKPIQLFNGRDTSGWKGLVPGAEMKWSVVDGVLRNAPPTTDISPNRTSGTSSCMWISASWSIPIAASGCADGTRSRSWRITASRPTRTAPVHSTAGWRLR
jgi:hypothetical protein